VIAAEQKLLILPQRRQSLIGADTPFLAFQDRRIQPLCHLSKSSQALNPISQKVPLIRLFSHLFSVTPLACDSWATFLF
jgi:hypothetical protein